MNRVRIVALAAVGLGVAVTVGTQFQQQATEPQRADAAAPVADSQIAQAEATQPSLAPQAAQLAGAASLPPVTAAAAPAVAQARVEVSVPAPGAVPGLPPEVAATLRAETARAQQTAQTAAPRAASLIPATAPERQPLASASIVPQTPLGLAPVVPQTPAQAEMLEPGLRAPLPDFPPAPEVQADAVTAAPLDDALRAEIDNCAVWVVVTPAPAAMLDMSLYAPCDRGADVAVTHAGLTFDTRVGADGQLMVMVPALAEDATVSVIFADGRQSSDRTFVPDLAAHSRVALQWQGPATLMLHAYEFGAQYGDAGHVHAGHPLAPGLADHGFVTVLGDPAIDGGRRAQVYSYPTSASQRRGAVSLEIEAPVTDASCGQAVDATAIELLSGSAVTQRAIHLDMPGCDGQGGYVVLPGVLPDLQIAMN
ncbi:MAG: hypothetical protein Kow0013_23040 [Pararhodobacter sp.]